MTTIEILNSISDSLAHVDNKLYQGYYHWLEEFVRITCPKTVVELGTYEGGSTVYLLGGLPPKSKLITIDIDNNYDLLRGNTDPRLTIITGDDLSDEVWGQVPDNIDLLFIDTNHTSEQAFKELQKYSEKFSPKCFVVLDDIHLPEMENFWTAITKIKYDISEWHGSGFGLVVYGGS